MGEREREKESRRLSRSRNAFSRSRARACIIRASEIETPSANERKKNVTFPVRYDANFRRVSREKKRVHTRSIVCEKNRLGF